MWRFCTWNAVNAADCPCWANPTWQASKVGMPFFTVKYSGRLSPGGTWQNPPRHLQHLSLPTCLELFVDLSMFLSFLFLYFFVFFLWFLWFLLLSQSFSAFLFFFFCWFVLILPIYLSIYLPLSLSNLSICLSFKNNMFSLSRSRRSSKSSTSVLPFDLGSRGEGGLAKKICLVCLTPRCLSSGLGLGGAGWLAGPPQ